MNSSNNKKCKYKFIVLTDNCKNMEYPLFYGTNIIGRDCVVEEGTNLIDLTASDLEAKVSHHHATVVINDNDALFISDNNSLNGVYINQGEKLEQDASVTLKIGDKILIGKTLLQLALE